MNPKFLLQTISFKSIKKFIKNHKNDDTAVKTINKEKKIIHNDVDDDASTVTSN